MTGAWSRTPDEGLEETVDAVPSATVVDASSYEAGQLWHLLDQRVGMPVTKVGTDGSLQPDIAAEGFHADRGASLTRNVFQARSRAAFIPLR